MTAAGTGAAADEIEAALALVAERLHAGDLVAASASAQTLAAHCRAAEGRRLDPAQLARLRALLDRCTNLADSAAGKLNDSLQRFSVSGRARKAYGDT